MQLLNERIVLIIILAITSISTLFCLIAVSAPGWGGITIFSPFQRTSTAALSVISLLLLIGCIIVAGIIIAGLLKNVPFPLIFVSLLIVTSLFLLGTFTSYAAPIFHSSLWYSYNLMITAFSFTYLTSILAVYWLVGLRDATDTNATSPN